MRTDDTDVNRHGRLPLPFFLQNGVLNDATTLHQSPAHVAVADILASCASGRGGVKATRAAATRGGTATTAYFAVDKGLARLLFVCCSSVHPFVFSSVFVSVFVSVFDSVFDSVSVPFATR